MAFDPSTLDAIYRMITPADLLGAQKISSTTKIDTNTAKDLINVIYNAKNTGVYSIDDLTQKIAEVTTNAPEGSIADLNKVFSLYTSSDIKVGNLGKAQDMAKNVDGTINNKVTFKDIVGAANDPVGSSPEKKMGILLLNSAYLAPQTRNAERVELFLNSIPSIVASRMVPYLEIEFAFHRQTPENLQSPGLMKFLLGSDQSAVTDPTSPTAKMIKMREVLNTKTNVLTTTAGMEMFLSPQTLVNASPINSTGRYVDVLDPFRPLMSIMSFTMTTTPTTGLMSYRKSSLVLKLHDRSRLNEISDLIRPQIYQNSMTAPTLWITHGWRHPDEPGNPYADFINGTMLVREAYNIANSNFAFDQLGQVTVTLELWTKGVSDLRTIKTNTAPDAPLKALQDITMLAEKISEYKRGFDIGTNSSANTEIRAFTVLEAAERGTYPEGLTQPDTIKAIDALKVSIATSGKKYDTKALENLIKALKDYYKADKNKPVGFDFNAQIKTQATEIVAKKIEEVSTGVDPFLPFTEKDVKKSKEAKTPIDSPFSTLSAAMNDYNSSGSSKELLALKTDLKAKKFTKKLVSLGKLVSVFMASALKTIDSIDELQLFFYQFNDHAGAAASQNIAEFPIEMPLFYDQYRDFVTRKGSESLGLEEFLKLVFDAQVDDQRALGYGFKNFFNPRDPNAPKDATLKKDSATKGANALGSFHKPQIEFYVETVAAVMPGNDAKSDLLSQFEQRQTETGALNGKATDGLKRIMRIHIFDKVNNPYKLAAQLLRSDSSDSPQYLEFEGTNPSKQTTIQNLQPILNGAITSQGKVSLKKGFSNQDIKEYVSKTVPSIIYGSNASMVISANLASKNDALMVTAQMQALAGKSGKASVSQPNGGGAGGLPLRVIPASMSMTTMGCPLLTFGQIFFVDFNTGTTIDNLYNLTGIVSTITPGKFESQLTLTFADAYGRYEGAPTIAKFIEQLKPDE